VEKYIIKKINLNSNFKKQSQKAISAATTKRNFKKQSLQQPQKIIMT
jgi:hypothetical protein